MQGKSIYKAGKLLKITLDYEEGKVSDVAIRGDFFLYPEESIEKLQETLKGTELTNEALKAKVDEFLQGAEAFGFDSQQLTEAIMQAVKGDAK